MSAARIVGIAGLASGGLQVILGMLLWAGFYEWMGIHFLNGLFFTVLVGVVAVMAIRARQPAGRIVLLGVWVVLLPAFGMTQASLLPGDLHWIIEVLHLAVGAVGMFMLFSTAEAMHRMR